MKIKLTIDIFSGRPNPTVTLGGTEAKKILDRLQPKTKFRTIKPNEPYEPFYLGFRGIIIEQIQQPSDKLPLKFRLTPKRLYANNRVAEAEENQFEDYVLDRLDKFEFTKNKKFFKKLFETELNRFRKIHEEAFQIIPIPIPSFPFFPSSCCCAPEPELAWWNDNGNVQFNNNCYNYSTNYRTDTFAQPGQAAGAMYTSLSGCTVASGQQSARAGAIADGLIAQPFANNQCTEKGHLVALVIAPDIDFHWYRKGKNGYWSHKPGGTQATVFDNAGHFIIDPRTADRGMYTQFCSFMQVIDGHIKII